MRKLFLAAALAALQTGVATAASPAIKPIFDVRLRTEAFDTPARTATADRRYSFTVGRVRAGLDATWTNWKLHGMVQAAGMTQVSRGAAFGSGQSYLAANGGDTSRTVIGISELSAAYTNGGFKAVLGRQPFADGNEAPTGIAHLDAVKKRRLSDRLVGNFEWPNVARRFDGASLSYGKGSAVVSGFALRPLDGAFDYEDAYEELDGVSVYGASLTGKYNTWVPASEVRAFAVQYDDTRRIARRQTGGDLKITTLGASILHGGENWDVLAWGALQSGDWGTADQDAWAYIVDVGRRFPAVAGKPTVHLAAEQSSGDDRPGGDHGTFFNVLPTNHKFYGSMDYFAWSNLRDVYLEALGGSEKLKVRFALHDFSLTQTRDAWYGGSGAFEDTSLGYAARLPVYGRFPSKDLGQEADLEFTYALPQGLQVGVGGGYFLGGDAAKAFLPLEEDGSWAYVELSWKR
ncbi:MAG: alginate export family protein [Thermoanaerobaculia bacterium]